MGGPLKPGQVRMDCPAGAERLQRSRLPSSSAAEAPIRRLMPLDVLIVDDSAAIRKIVQRVLRQAELPLGQIYEAGDGLEALKTLGSQKVDLILADINMPNMDGLQLLENIKANEKWKHLPVVMVTTEGSESKVMSAAKLGAVGYVRKPFSAEQFRQTLDGIFAV